MIQRAYKVQLKPNNQQKTLFKMNCGAARWAFNWALTKKKEAFDKREKIPNYIELSRELTTLSEMVGISPSLKQEFNKKSIDRFL